MGVVFDKLLGKPLLHTHDGEVVSGVNERFSRGDEASLPGTDADLENAYTAANKTTISADNGSRVSQTATSEYVIHQFKNFVGSVTSRDLSWNGQSDLAPSGSEVFLQIYNHNSASWDAVDSDSATGADTDFTLTDTVSDLLNYKNENNVISCRVYQLAV